MPKSERIKEAKKAVEETGDLITEHNSSYGDVHERLVVTRKAVESTQQIPEE